MTILGPPRINHTYKNCGSIVSSKPFEFFVGSQSKSITVHSALVAYHSKPLGVLVEGQFSEAEKGRAILTHVDEQTFVRFSQYAYTGDYDAAEHEIILDSSVIDHTDESRSNLDTEDGNDGNMTDEPALAVEVIEVPTEPAVGYDELFPRDPDDYNWKGNLKREKKRQTKPLSMRSKFWDRFKENEHAFHVKLFDPRPNSEECEDYSEVFLSHARLYVFGDTYDIAPLRKLALHKLQRTLVVFNLYKERVGDIVKLLGYSYSHTVNRPSSQDKLRSLVVHYAASLIEKLSGNEEFDSLLEGNGALGRDIISKMLERLD